MTEPRPPRLAVVIPCYNEEANVAPMVERLDAALAGVKRVLVVEQNHGGQLLSWLRAAYDLPARPAGFHRPGPLPLRPGEIAEAILAWRNA